MNAVRQPGLKAGPYELVAPLGAGGMGEVWLALDSRLGRRVAIKFAHEEFNERFEREARAIAALNHPHIATLHDIGPDYLVMELVEGQPLRGPLPPGEVARLGLEIAAALAAAHEKGVIHRDLKPANILRSANGVKLLDFGLAKQQTWDPSPDERTIELTQGDVVAGTPHYMSPEQARGLPVGPASDLYSLGAVLYFCLTGRPPFQGANAVDVLMRAAHDPPPALQSGDERLNGIVLKLLAKDPAARFASAAELMNALRHVEADLGSPDAPTEWVAPVAAGARPPWRSRWLAAAAAAVILGACFAGWLHFKARPVQPTAEAERWYQEGTNALRDGLYLKASRSLERAVALDGRFAVARVRLAEALSELDSLDKARESLLQAASANPGTLTERNRLLRDAVQSTLTGEYTRAAEYHRRILEMVPDEEKPAAYVDLGRALEKAEKPVGAVESYREAARLSPRFAAAFLRLGVLLGRRRDLDGAEEAFRQAEAHFRDLGAPEGEIEVLYQRALTLNRAGRFDEASSLVERALEMSRHAHTPHQEVVLLIQRGEIAAHRGRTEEAGTHATAAIELARREQLESLIARALIGLGNAHFVGRNPAAAEDFFKQGLEYAKRWKNRRAEARALVSLGSFHIQNGRLDEGVPNVEAGLTYYRGMESRTETIQCLILLARAARDRGDYAKSEELFREQLELARVAALPHEASNALSGLGSLAMLLERYAEGRDRYRQALEALGPEAMPLQKAYTLLSIARAEIELGRLQEARRLQEQASEAVRGLGSEGVVQQRRAAQLNLIALIERRPRSGVPPASGESADESCSAAGILRNRDGVQRHCPAAWPAIAAESYLETGDRQAAAAAAKLALERARAEGRNESEFRAALVLARLSPQDAGMREAARGAWEKWRGAWKPEEFRVYSTRPDVRHRLRLLQQ